MIRSAKEGLEIFKKALKDLKKFAKQDNLPTRKMTVEGLTPRHCALPDYTENEIYNRILELQAMVKVLKLTAHEVAREWGAAGLGAGEGDAEDNEDED